MATYTATNNIDDLVATTPSGADKPSELDDAIREIKLVLKAVMGKAHKGKGGQRAFTYKAFSAVGVTTVSNNAWNRIALATLNDPTGLTTAGFTNSIQLVVAGTYWIEFWSQFLSTNTSQCRVAEATGNTTAPSASTSIADLVGNVTHSGSAASYAYARSMGAGLWTTDGSKSICLDVINSNSGNLNTAIGTNGISGQYAGIAAFFLGDLT